MNTYDVKIEPNGDVSVRPAADPECPVIIADHPSHIPATLIVVAGQYHEAQLRLRKLDRMFDHTN
jgi:hypothetical protein